MRTIEITTTQNVVIQVKLATLLDRIVGFILDLIFLVLGYLLLFWITILVVETSFNDLDNFYIVYLIYVILFSFYSLIFEVTLRGQTPGKLIMGVKVIKVDGTQPEFIDYFRRWALRWIDILGSFGAVAMTSVSTSEKGQRLGDKIADTIVVKKKQVSGYELKDILGITSSASYKPIYPEVRELTEQHMLTLKRLLNRKQKFPNISMYNQLLLETGQKFEAYLSIKKKERGYVDFLRQLLKDYVILTR